MVFKVNPYKSPYSCYINLTNKCNLRCRHCLGNYGNAISNELGIDEWKHVFDEIIKNKIFYINISGGEPTVHPNFKEIITYLNEIKLHFILTTNGYFSKDILSLIIKNQEYLIGVKISLDGYDNQSHEYIRKAQDKDVFKITTENIFKLSKAGIPLTIASVIHSENIKNFNKFIDLIKRINPISWYISPIIPSGRGKNFLSVVNYNYYDKSFWERIVNKCKKNKINVKLIDLPFDMKSGEVIDYYQCGAALSFCEINADGQVSPCTLCRTCIPKKDFNFPNIVNQSLKDIWNGEIFQNFRNLMTKGCEGCKAFDKCHKCIAQSFAYFDNGISPTPYCIRNPSIKLKNIKHYEQILK